MAKVYTYMVIFAGIDLLFLLSGIGSAGFDVLSGLGITDNIFTISAITLGVYFTAIITSAIGSLSLQSSGSTIIGTLKGGAITAAIIATYVTPMLAVIYDIVKIIGLGRDAVGFASVIGYLMALILIPLIVGYVVAIWSWINGND